MVKNQLGKGGGSGVVVVVCGSGGAVVKRQLGKGGGSEAVVVVSTGNGGGMYGVFVGYIFLKQDK